MEKIIRIIHAALVAAVLSLVLGACGDDEPNPDNPDVVNPTTPTADPIGTINLAMHNKVNGETMLDGIGIGEDNNFYGKNESYYRTTFCDIGEVAGLGNITTIPVIGWASKVQVVPGHGYVAVREERDYYGNYSVEAIYRIFVLDWIGSAEGGIIGANIKYQTPFAGADAAISVDKTSVEISEDNPLAEISVVSNTYIAFDIEVDGPFNVQRIYSSNPGFITEKLAITSIEPIFPTESASGTIKLVTSTGKTTEIAVTQRGAMPHITMANNEISFRCYGLTAATLRFTTNIKAEITATSECDWIKAEINRNSDSEGEVRVITSTNCTNDSRTGYVIIKSGATSCRVKVSQDGFSTVPVIDDVVETGPESGWRYIYAYDTSIHGDYIDFRDLTISKDDGLDWVTYTSRNYQGVELELSANKTGVSREGRIFIYYPQGGIFDDVLVASFTIRQLAE